MTLVGMELPFLTPINIPPCVFLKTHANHHLKTSEHQERRHKQYKHTKESPPQTRTVRETSRINWTQYSYYLNTAQASFQIKVAKKLSMQISNFSIKRTFLVKIRKFTLFELLRTCMTVLKKLFFQKVS